jgi:hypothetical protein
MITRLSTVTCPDCGHTGKPQVKGEGHALLMFIPVVGDVIAAKDALSAKLHCAGCGLRFTDSAGSKIAAAASAGMKAATSAIGAARGRFGVPANPAAKFCPACGVQTDISSRFCSACGSAY